MVDPQPERAQMEPRSLKHKPTVMPAWSIWVGAGAVLIVATVSMLVLFVFFGAGTPADKIRLEIIKLAGSIVVGTGGAAALLLAARRQRSTELGLMQTERDLAYKEQVARDTRHDASERRATELYTAAAEQLASDKAPVRLAGLYALERFGQANPEYRQTVVNVLCAYLRMPFSYPSSAPATSQTTSSEVEHSGQNQRTQEPLLLDLAPALANAAGLSLDNVDQQKQELQVRLTAQRILIEHLQPSRERSDREGNKKFWEGMQLDLAHAVLIDFHFYGGSITYASFEGAHFHGDTLITSVTNTEEVSFEGARFHGKATLALDAEGPAVFTGARFYGLALLGGCRFSIVAEFDGAHFYRKAIFLRADFSSEVNFEGARFHDEAIFERAYFGDRVTFEGARFDGLADFSGALFEGVVKFEGAAFGGETRVRGARYRSDVQRMLDLWPAGWRTRGRTRASEESSLEGFPRSWGFLTKVDDSGER